MKWIIGIAAVLTLISALHIRQPARLIAEANRCASMMIASPAIEAASHISDKAWERSEQLRKESRDARMEKVFVPGRDAKTCMARLKTNVINNRVVECNNDHYVQLRHDEVAA